MNLVHVVPHFGQEAAEAGKRASMTPGETVISEPDSIRDLIRSGRIIFGCGRLHRLASPRKRFRLVEEALSAGILDFDVAPAYGNGLSERTVGEVLRGAGTAARVHTKAGIPVNIYPPFADRLFALARLTDILVGNHGKVYEVRDFTLPRIRQSLAESLERLRLDFVETLFLHEPARPFAAGEFSRIRGGLECLRRDGLIRRWGIAGPVIRYQPADFEMTDFPVIQLPLGEALERLDELSSGRGRQSCHVYGVVGAFRQRKWEGNLESFVVDCARRLPCASFVLGTSRRDRLREWGKG